MRRAVNVRLYLTFRDDPVENPDHPGDWSDGFDRWSLGVKWNENDSDGAQYGILILGPRDMRFDDRRVLNVMSLLPSIISEWEHQPVEEPA